MKCAPWMLAGIACLLLSGCASLTGGDKAKNKSKKDSSWFSWKKKEYQTPHSMAVIWSEDVLTVPGKPPTRGFGGRIYFYNEKSQAIPVEGELMVYGYDESAVKPASTAAPAADKRFRFTSEQFTQHFSESELGASYSIWIPWDEAGGFSKKVSLIPAFTCKDGRLVRGEAAKLTLAGRSPTGLPDYNTSTVQQVSHTEATNPGIQLPRGMNLDQSMRTTTIDLPSATTRRLAVPTSTDSKSIPPAGTTNVQYGNGMTPQQMQAAIASGMFGVGAMHAQVPNVHQPTAMSASHPALPASIPQSVPSSSFGIQAMTNPPNMLPPTSPQFSGYEAGSLHPSRATR